MIFSSDLLINSIQFIHREHSKWDWHADKAHSFLLLWVMMYSCCPFFIWDFGRCFNSRPWWEVWHVVAFPSDSLINRFQFVDEQFIPHRWLNCDLNGSDEFILWKDITEFEFWIWDTHSPHISVSSELFLHSVTFDLNHCCFLRTLSESTKSCAQFFSSSKQLCIVSFSGGTVF